MHPVSRHIWFDGTFLRYENAGIVPIDGTPYIIYGNHIHFTHALADIVNGTAHITVPVRDWISSV